MAASTEDRYVYKPLPNPEQYIRLLSLEPSYSFEDPIVCEVEVVRLAASRKALSSPIARLHRFEYTALSYSWGMNETGDATLNRSITVCGKSLAITQNLFEGLQRIRPRVDGPSHNASQLRTIRTKLANYAKSIRIWVDAVCIDQTDTTERSAQVSMMDRIYEYASRLFIWLGDGPSEHEDRAVLAILKCMPKAVDNLYYRRKVAYSHHYLRRGHALDDNHCWQNAKLGRVSLCKLDIDGSRTGDFLKGNGSGTDAPEDVASTIAEMAGYINNIVHRRYFRRRWIIQEIYYGRRQGSCEVYWGPVHCSHEVFASGLEQVTNLIDFFSGRRLTMLPLYSVPLPTTESMVRVTNLLELNWRTSDDEVRYWWDSNRKPSKVNLLQALMHFQSHECSDLRDTLYAVATLDRGFGLRPDYASSLEDVYTTFARMLVEKGHCLAALSNLDHAIRQSRGVACEDSYGWQMRTVPILDLPSWVPDLRGAFATSEFESSCEETRVLPGNSLECSLPCAAVVEAFDVVNEVPHVGLCSANYDKSDLVVTYAPTELLRGAIPREVYKDDALPKRGDFICHLVKSGHNRSMPMLVLRPTEEDIDICIIVNALDIKKVRNEAFLNFFKNAPTRRLLFNIK